MHANLQILVLVIVCSVKSSEDFIKYRMFPSFPVGSLIFCFTIPTYILTIPLGNSSVFSIVQVSETLQGVELEIRKAQTHFCLVKKYAKKGE